MTFRRCILFEVEDEGMSLTDDAKQYAVELGADLVGVAPVERFANAPLRMSPQGLLPEARSVVVMAVHHPDAAVELGGEPRPQRVGPYAVQYWMNNQLDDLSFLMARFLEDRGHAALPIAASNIWRYHGYKDLKVDFAPDLVHRYAAVAAGLGEIGWNNLTLTPEFGPRCRFVSVVTDAVLDATPMYDGPPLCDRCMACVEHCPMDTFRKETRGTVRIEIGGREYEFPDTNKWRCAWAENFDLSLSITPPEKVDEKVILEHLERYGMDGGAEGSCLKFCMVPALRVDDPDYCSAPRRKKQPVDLSPEKLFERLLRLTDRNPIDVLAVAQADVFPDDGPVHPALHLPDAVSVISVGIRIPPDGDKSDEMRDTMRRRLRYAARDLARELDVLGFSAICMTEIHDTLVADRLGIFEGDMAFTTVLTSGKLPTTTWRVDEDTAVPTADALRSLCRDAGADLVGVFGVDRFAAFREAVADIDTASKPSEFVEDKGLIYGPFVPAVSTQDTSLQGPEDHLPGAKSVIVLGLHFPDASLDTSKITPAETVGPYVFACYESRRLLADIANRLIRRLNQCGHRAVLTSDLTGQASTVQSSRGMLPDMRSNRFAAMLSGLATIGINGSPLTPQYGVRQRFMAVVTDLPLPSDPLPTAASPCADCSKPCIAACPTAALKDRSVSLEIDGATFTIPVIDGFACDWAKRLGLVGEEGPRFAGMDNNVAVPADRSVAAVASAVAQAKWGVQKRHLTIGEECIRVCPAKGQRQ
jgi:epoxyqueuosine reductase QueG